MELRKHYYLDKWVLIAANRDLRPMEYRQTKQSTKESGICFFCPGNERLTPKEDGRTGEADKWQVRWFANKFPAVSDKAKGKPVKGLLTKIPAYGYHEIIVETPKHNVQLYDLRPEDLAEVLKVYSHLTKEYYKKPNIKYVSIFKNHGPKGGTSLVHSHSQVIALSIIPEEVKNEISGSLDSCPYCAIIKKERGGPRQIMENDSFLVIAPHASRFNFEALIMPKKHISSMAKLKGNQYFELAEALLIVLKQLKTLNLSFNYYVHQSIDKGEIHMHLEICPRIAEWAGFEFSTGIIINSVTPEQAAKFYQSKL